VPRRGSLWADLQLEAPAGSPARLACALALSVALGQSENRKTVVAQSALRDFRDLPFLVANFPPTVRNLRNFTHLDVVSSQSQQPDIALSQS
jgi:hypothetical protein